VTVGTLFHLIGPLLPNSPPTGHELLIVGALYCRYRGGIYVGKWMQNPRTNNQYLCWSILTPLCPRSRVCKNLHFKNGVGDHPRVFAPRKCIHGVMKSWIFLKCNMMYLVLQHPELTHFIAHPLLPVYHRKNRLYQ